MIILGIETSCDETAAAVVDDEGVIRGELVLSQIEAHRPFGGVVPEIAARNHVAHLDRLIVETMDEAGATFPELDCVAATAGPGLIGGLLVGVMTAKAIAAVHALPFLAINHLEAHALVPRMLAPIAFPYLVLLISGGHCQLLIANGVGSYSRLGTTIDDAVGEAFDKTAKMLGLDYPGGPAIEAAACGGDPARFKLPRPLINRAGADFSFSGLKTAVRHTIHRLPDAPTATDAKDIAAAFQIAVGDVLCNRTANAMQMFSERTGKMTGNLVVAGGVAANQYLGDRLKQTASDAGFQVVVPPPALCTDNAAMIAWAGIERRRAGFSGDPLDTIALARWPLDPVSARPGAKA
jgi:N6-L-threonylcarbamoyladenine synthase